MSLQIEHLQGCVRQYEVKLYEGRRNLGLYIGYMEACLVNFDVIESKNNGVGDYCNKIVAYNFLGIKTTRDENREEIVYRLCKTFLKDLEVKKSCG